MAGGLTTLAHTLALRLRQIVRMLDRLDRLEAGSGDWLESQGEANLESAAREMTLRALRTAADPANFGLLDYLQERPSCPVAELERAAGLDRITLNERINDLIQIGLLSREIDTDVVQISDAGIALVLLYTDIYKETSRRLQEALTPVTRLE
jgi:DNA-binding MarR family transcriptional regulator